MIEMIKEMLQSSGADAWQIRDVRTKGWEFYFIKKQLDQNRAKDVRHITVTVFKKSEDGQMIGSASSEINPTAAKEEVQQLTQSLVYRASLVKNKIYELTKPQQAEQLPACAYDVRDVSADFIRALKTLDETATEDLNSAEVFVSDITEHLITSEGIDIVQTYPSSMAETVINARNGGHEIELYRMFKSGTCDSEKLRKDLAKAMKCGKDRLLAIPTPSLGEIPVIFSGSDAVNIYWYFLDNINAQYIYRGFSSWKLNEAIDPQMTGDKVTIKALRYLDNSPYNRMYDREGAAIRDEVLIEDGVVKNYTGSRMFADYIGMKDSFIISNFSAEGGTCTEEEIRCGTYLEAVDFSDFQVDPLTGDIFGEIRLAYLHENGKVTPVSGGSLSGNMKDLRKTMRMTKETMIETDARIPVLTRLENVTLTGADS